MGSEPTIPNINALAYEGRPQFARKMSELSPLVATKTALSPLTTTFDLRADILAIKANDRFVLESGLPGGDVRSDAINRHRSRVMRTRNDSPSFSIETDDLQNQLIFENENRPPIAADFCGPVNKASKRFFENDVRPLYASPQMH